MDHLVFASPELEPGVHLVEGLVGARMAPGGRHDGFGTRNRLLGFGPTSYMEVVSVDPDQPAPGRARWFGLDTLVSPRLVTWCAATPDLDATIARARSAGLDLGDPLSGQRARPDGSVLRWRMSDPWADRCDGILPFLIEWGDSVHPGTTLPTHCTFLGLRAEHPDAGGVRAWVDLLGLDMEIAEGQAPRLTATLDTPNGIVELT